MAEDNSKKIVWPSNILKEAIEKADSEEKRIEIRLTPDVEDVTFETDAITHIKTYAPDISQIGPGLFRERVTIPGIGGKTWGGLLVRALEEKDTKRRCLQYIYIWTKQKSVVSMLWMVWAPLLMGCLGVAVWWFYGPLIAASDLLLPSLATGFVSLPLLFTGLYDHRADLLSLLRREIDLHLGFRSTTMLIPHSLMMWLVPFSHIWAWLIIGIAVVFAVYWGLDVLGRVGTSHPMDYLPIFVWIKKEDGKESWEFEKAYWDKFHYQAECRKKEELRESDFVQDKIREKGVRLQMDNPWHSVRAGGHVAFRLWLLSILFVLVVPVALYYVVEAGRFTEWPNDGFMFILLLFFMVAAVRTAVRFPTELVTEDDLESLKLPKDNYGLTQSSEATKNHLNEERLKVLWNLVYNVEEPEKIDVRPRFVVITKLQDPFNYYNHPDNYHDTFRDDLEYLYVYINHRCRFTLKDSKAGALVKEIAQQLHFDYKPQDMAELEADPEIQDMIPSKGSIDKTASRRIKEIVEEKQVERTRVEEKRVKEKLARRKRRLR